MFHFWITIITVLILPLHTCIIWKETHGIKDMKQRDMEVKNHPETDTKVLNFCVYMLVWGWELSAKEMCCKDGSVWNYCAGLVKGTGNPWQAI